MADRVPLVPIAGSLASQVGILTPIQVVAADTPLLSAFPSVSQAPSGGPVILEILADSVVLATVTIADGQKSGSWQGSAEIPAGQTLGQRVSAAPSSALGLGGNLETGQSFALATLQDVKARLSQKSADFDSQLSRMIEGMSLRFESYTGRDLVSRTRVEYLDGGWAALVAGNRPINGTPTIEEYKGSALDPSTFEVEAEAGLIYKADRTAWVSGFRRYKLTYQTGYPTTPADLRDACTDEVASHFSKGKAAQAPASLGAQSKSTAAGDSTSYLTDPFLPHVQSVLDTYKRVW